MKVTVSVPGKVILMGDHAVVHGKPALVAAINKRMYITITDAVETGESDAYVHFIMGLLEKELKQQFPPLNITISSDVPPGYHLGTSAMVAVGTIAALLYATKKIWNPQRVNQFAYEAEKKQHGTPSGVDNTTITFGGLLWYRKELEFLKSMWQLPFKPSKKLHNFFLIKTTKPKETTGEMVALVAAMVKRQASRMGKLFNENERQTKRVAVALKEGNERELIDAMQAGERTLEEMGVVSEKVKPLIRALEKSGGAAKILGGGGITDGVGYLLCYHPHEKKVKIECEPFGYEVEPIVLGEEGLRLEKYKMI